MNTSAPTPPATAHVHASDLRGASRLAIDATLGLTGLVENLHSNIARAKPPLGTPSQAPTRGITGLVYRSIRGVTRLVGGSLDALLGQVDALLGPPVAAASPEREAVLAALNGVMGDHLEASGNPLAIRMHLRHAGQPLALTAPGLAALAAPRPRIVLLIHGLCMNSTQWRRKGHDHGAMLAEALDATPLYLHYNSGRHVSTNGAQLAALLQSLSLAWPVPLEEIVIVGHSMGGLLARSALAQAADLGHDWPRRVQRVVFLGTPHHGSPLERGGHWIDRILDTSPYTAAFARLGKLRSAGITDLRHGNVLAADWEGADRFASPRDHRVALPLPAGVACYALAGALGEDEGALHETMLGDGLVPLASALGQHKVAKRRLLFAPERQWVARGVHHMDLLSDAVVAAQLRQWLAPPGDNRPL